MQRQAAGESRHRTCRAQLLPRRPAQDQPGFHTAPVASSRAARV
jgi:hypothetical protein